MNDDDMTLEITTRASVTQPASPCAAGAAMPCARRNLDPTVGVPLVKKLFRSYLDSFLDVFFTYPPSLQTDGGDGIPRRRRVAIHGRR